MSHRKKELVEFARDWRTILAILIIPLLMFPLLFILPLLLASEAAELDALVVDVVVQGDDIPADMGLSTIPRSTSHTSSAGVRGAFSTARR